MAPARRRARAWRLLTSAALLAAIAPRALAEEASGPSTSPQALIREIRELASVRDLAGLLRLRPRAAPHPVVEAVLAAEIYWTGDVGAAAPDLAAACQDDRLPPDAAPRRDACARLAFAALAQGRPLRTLRAAGQGTFRAEPPSALLVAQVSLDGNPPVPFIVDTGAPTTVVSRAYADHIHLDYRRDLAERSQDVGGNPIELHPALVRRLRWGEIEVGDLPVHVQRFPAEFQLGGLLSPFDLLRGVAFELDGVAGALRVWPAGAAPAWTRRLDDPSLFHASLLWSGGDALVPARLDRLPRLPFLLDSGGGLDLVCEEALRADGVPLGSGLAIAVPSSAGTTAMRRGLEGVFGVGAEALRPASLATLRCPDDRSLGRQPSGYVGAPWFRAHRAYFPADRQSLIFDEPAAPRDGRPRDR